MRRFFYVILCALGASCATINVNYDYDKAVDFNNYKTYNYYANLDTGLSELDTERLLVIIDSAMTSKGHSLSSEPDFYIDIQSNAFQNNSGSSVGIGVGGSGGNVGGGMSVGIPLGQSKYGRLIKFDFVDEKDKGLFWQAISESSFNPDATPEKREANLKAVVNKVLSQYPPERN